uniref:NADH dehydrogenase subunit 6 n=1 Tax=Melanips sp. ZJUH 20220003 TaxID=2943452 RepID=A0A9E8G6P6_9HYME|nr:NADH dehydrogenase subunit 6 [Melanips sp. ZJUH 20220003]
MMMFIKFIINNFFTLFLMMCMVMILFPSNFKKIHPLVMGSLMLMISIFISLSLNFYNKSSLYSLLMYLIVIGGFLILFLYFNSFALNNKVTLNFDLFFWFIYKYSMLLLMFILIIYEINNFNLIMFINNNLLEMNFFNLNYYKNNIMPMINIYLKFYLLTFFGMIYLFYTLIIVVKMLYYTKPKALRQGY